MSKKYISMFSLLIITILMTACGQPPVAQPQGQPISMEVINTLVAQTVSAMQAQVPPTLEPPPPTDTPSAPTITLTPTLSKPFIVATVNTNCRTGAAVSYEVVGAVNKDVPAEVLGMWANGYWYLVRNPNDPPYGKCWVWGDPMIRIGNWSAVPNVIPPLTPTPSRTPTP